MLYASPCKSIHNCYLGFSAGSGNKAVSIVTVGSITLAGFARCGLPDRNYTPSAQPPQQEEVIKYISDGAPPNPGRAANNSLSSSLAEINQISSSNFLPAENKQANNSFQPTSQQWALWREVGAGGDYSSSNSNVIMKWPQNKVINLCVHGADQADMSFLQTYVIPTLNSVIAQNGNRIQLSQGCSGGDLNMRFVPLEQIARETGHTQAAGLAMINAVNGDIQNGRIYIATQYTDPTTRYAASFTREERNHAILEEVTQATGIMRDTLNYPGSIFYEGPSALQQLSPDDIAVLTLHYNPAIQPGMSITQAEQAFMQNQAIQPPQQYLPQPMHQQQTIPSQSVPPIIIPNPSRNTPYQTTIPPQQPQYPQTIPPTQPEGIPQFANPYQEGVTLREQYGWTPQDCQLLADPEVMRGCLGQ